MRAKLICVGEKMPTWVMQAFAEYSKRLSHELPLQLVEVAPAPRGRNVDVARAIAHEGEQLLAAIPERAHVIALDVRGKAWSSEALAEQLAKWRMHGRDLIFLIGGADGFSAAVIARAEQQWSLGPATFPHPIVRILVAEQLYRAVSQLANHPYHRG